MAGLKVTVIGAGIAGLTAAYRLQQKGFLVEVLEAHSYPGGRMAQRESAGITYNTGARLCYSFYREVNKLADELGLTAAIVRQPAMNIFCGSGHDRYRLPLSPDIALLLSPLLPIQEKVKLFSLLPDLLYARANIDPAWMATASRFDEMTLADYIQEKVGPKFLQHFIEPVFQGTRNWGANEVSAAFFVSTSAQMLFGGYTYNFSEGIGQLGRELAAQLNVSYEVRVDRVTRNNRGRECSVYCDIRGEKHEIKSDLVVCAVEGSRVPDLIADPDQQETAFFSSVKYNSLGIVHVLSRNREKTGVTFFPRQHPGGLSILEISDSGADAAWPSKLYCQLAPELAEQAQNEAKTDNLFELIQPTLLAQCPGLGTDREHIVNQWIENMLPLFYPGYIGKLSAFLQYQENTRHRIYYCGDYLSQALLEGACLSGFRAAENIALHWDSGRSN